jgi:hypothetical protein
MKDEERDWVKILNYFYEEQAAYTKPPTEMNDEQVQTIATECDLSTDDLDEIRRTMEFMRRLDLYGQEEEGKVAQAELYGLTRKGFDVAHEREMERERSDRRSQQTSQVTLYLGMLAGFGLILVVREALRATNLLFNISNPVNIIYGILIIVVIGFLTFKVVRNPESWTDELESL